MSDFEQAMTVLDALEKLGTKRKSKFELMQQHSTNQALCQIFKSAYDWESTYGMRVPFHTAGAAATQRTKPLFGAASKDARPPWDAFQKLLGDLEQRRLTGNAARDAWALLVSRLSEKEHQWFSRVINRDLKIGIDRPTIELAWPELIRPFGVQLAKSMKDVETFEPTKKDPWLSWPVIVEAKLDGMRVIIRYDDQTKTCTGFSREGHMLTNLQGLLDPLAPFLAAAHGSSCWLDTEILADQTKTNGFNATMSLVKKEDVTPEDRALLQFHCFDLVKDTTDETPLHVRRAQLDTLFECYGRSEIPSIPSAFRILERKTARNMEELLTIYNAMLDLGHEGVMVKFSKAPYRPKRTSAWLKLKPTETVDAEITGFEAGKQGGKNEHRLGAFVVRRGDTGQTIRVGGGLTDVQRNEFWADRDNLLGKVLEFKEEKRTGAETTVNFPRFIRMRPDRSRV